MSLYITHVSVTPVGNFFPGRDRRVLMGFTVGIKIPDKTGPVFEWCSHFDWHWDPQRGPYAGPIR